MITENLLRIKNEWDQMDKSNFSEKLELEYDENDPLFIKLKTMAEEIEMPIDEFISALIYERYKNELESI